MPLELRHESHTFPIDRAETGGCLPVKPCPSKHIPRTASPESSFRFETVRVDRHDKNLRREWDVIRSANHMLRSPFFSYQFIEAVDEICGGMETSFAHDGNTLAAILSFRRRRNKDAGPVGAGINDAHAMMVKPGARISFIDLLHHAGLQSFAFHAAPPDCEGIRAFEIGRTKSFLADLTVDERGYEHFLRSTSVTINRQGQKTRRLAHQQGAIRLEYDCRDAKLIEYFIELKGAQYRRTHTFNILGVDWIGKLLHRLHEDRDAQVRGLLSVLYAGDKPVAVHYGLLEGDLLHYWFPVFEPSFSYASPGTILFLEIAKEATANGVKAIDMGYGEQPYKHKLTNVVGEMSYGLVDRSQIRRTLYRARLAMRQQCKSLWFKDHMKSVVRRVLPNLDEYRYQ